MSIDSNLYIYGNNYLKAKTIYTTIELISTFLLQIYYYYLRNIFPKEMKLLIIVLLISETF